MPMWTSLWNRTKNWKSHDEKIPQSIDWNADSRVATVFHWSGHQLPFTEFVFLHHGIGVSRVILLHTVCLEFGMQLIGVVKNEHFGMNSNHPRGISVYYLCICVFHQNLVCNLRNVYRNTSLRSRVCDSLIIICQMVWVNRRDQSGMSREWI